MSLHRLSKSKNLIGALERLGKVLDYHVALEHPLPSEGDVEAPAVDVAWFGAAEDKFPLVLFEVETVASNSMAHNALKVLSQETAIFEKPLFFFHVIARGGRRSSRPQELHRQFGAHNYRVYRLAEGDGTQLVCDVLGQHRRIRSTIDFARLYETCQHDDWGGAVDSLRVLRFARDLGLSTAEYLPSLVHLARDDIKMLDEVQKTLADSSLSQWVSDAAFSSYIGDQFGDGVLSAVCLGIANSEAEQVQWNARLEGWQGGLGSTAAIAPSVGFSFAYDEFLYGAAGALVALLVSAARGRGTSCRVLCQALGKISEQMGSSWAAANAHVWTCHVAARLRLDAVFATGQRGVNRLGGLPRDFVLTPRPLAFREERAELDVPGRIPIPDMAEFREMANLVHATAGSDPTELALRAIDDDDFVVRWSQPIVRSLWSSFPTHE